MNDNSGPQISIIVAVFNGAKTLQQCIDSVSCQTYSNKELIIVDGGSSDGTVDLLKANCAQINFWISEHDSGIYSAFNKGLVKARGDWICFLGADDYFWNPQVLEKVSQQLTKLPPNICVAYGQVVMVNMHGEILYQMGEQWQNIKERFGQAMCIPHIGTMHRRSLFEKHGYYDESFRISGDYELLLRELPTNDAFFISDTVVAATRLGGISWNIANSFLIMQENIRAVRMHCAHPPAWFSVKAGMKACLKLILNSMLGKRLAMKALDIYWRISGMPAFLKRP